MRRTWGVPQRTQANARRPEAAPYASQKPLPIDSRGGAGSSATLPIFARYGVSMTMDERAFRFEVPGAGSVSAVATAAEDVDAVYVVGYANLLWPTTPLFAGGKSFGGRMASQAQALEPLPGVLGLMFLGFPLHPAGKPSLDRAPHLLEVGVPMLFTRGTRDALAEEPQHEALMRQLGPAATHAAIEAADHSFQVLKRSGRSDDDVMEQVLDWLLVWSQGVLAQVEDDRQ